eukprot:COSAG02_NODE_3694_length_6364_cov_3.261950_5_plen_627_part_00
MELLTDAQRMPHPTTVQRKTASWRGGVPGSLPGAEGMGLLGLAGGGVAQSKFKWQDAIPMLQAGTAVRERPWRLTDTECCQQQVFMENPVLRRRKGSDKWQTSGGAKGATELWSTSGKYGVQKRYGRVVRKGLQPLQFSQYKLLGQSVEAENRMLWVVKPLEHVLDGPVGQHEEAAASSSPPSSPPLYQPVATAPARAASVTATAAEPYRLTAPAHALGQSAVDICSSSKFISFRSERGGEEGLELGSVVRKHELGGVTLQSSQGDFAEWYKLASGQAPFEEGDVVGFSRGRITRKTTGCAMLGVISRKAVVEGSAPPESERHLYDTVAHCGVVPVKLSLRSRRSGMQCECPMPHAGQLLTPSGLHDGTAVLVPATESVSRVGVLLDATTGVGGGTSDAEVDLGENGGHVLVTVLVTAPTQTVPHGTVVWAHQLRRVVLAMVWLLGSLTIAMVLESHMKNAGRVSHVRLEPDAHATPERINGSSCDCGGHGTCSEGICVCDDDHAGKFCNGTEWLYGKMGQSCSTVCAEVGLACSDGDWGAASKASMWAALAAAGMVPGTLCDHWSSSDWEGDPSVYVLPSSTYPELRNDTVPQQSPFSVTCGWQSGAHTICSMLFPGHQRLCLCV